MSLINLVFCFKENKKLPKVGNLMEGNGCEGLELKYDFIKKCWKMFFNLGYFKCLMMLETISDENWAKFFLPV